LKVAAAQGKQDLAAGSQPRQVSANPQDVARANRQAVAGALVEVHG